MLIKIKKKTKKKNFKNSRDGVIAMSHLKNNVTT